MQARAITKSFAEGKVKSVPKPEPCRGYKHYIGSPGKPPMRRILRIAFGFFMRRII